MAEAIQRISPEEFRYWQAFDRVSPLGGERQDWHTALVSALMANLWTAGQRYTPQDFVPQWGATAAVQSPQAFEALQAWTEAMGGAVATDWTEAQIDAYLAGEDSPSDELMYGPDS